VLKGAAFRPVKDRGIRRVWHQVVNIERRWRQIRKDTDYEWVTPHTFRKTVATLISEAATSELASRQLGHSSSQVTRDHYIAKPPVSADLSKVLERLAESDDASSDS
jgi:integrase